MADHGVNRRKSHHARKRQRQGKMKAALWKKKISEHRKNEYKFWHSIKEEVGT